MMLNLGSFTTNVDYSIAYGINDPGQVIGYSTTDPAADYDAFLYRGSGLQDLGNLGGKSRGFAINNQGQIVGASVIDAAGHEHAFLWQNGLMTDLGTAAGAVTSQALNINNNGQIVGTLVFGPGLSNRGFLYSNGTMIDLNTLLPTGSGWLLDDAQAVNDLGQIVGLGDIGGQQHAYLLSPVPEPSTLALVAAAVPLLVFGRRGIRWITGRRKPVMSGSCQIVGLVVISLTVLGSVAGAATVYSITDLGTLPGGGASRPYGINDNAQIVGLAFTNQGQHSFLWQAGTGMQDLGPLGGPYSVGQGINDSGLVVGGSNQHLAAGPSFAWSWKNGTVQNLGTLGGTLSEATGVNNSGQIVGGATNSGNMDRAFLWQSGSGMQDLGTLGGPTSYAWAINDNGQVAGDADTPSSGTHAYIWQAGAGMKDLGTFPSGGNSVADAINNHAQLAGIAETSSGLHHAFLWQSGSGMLDLGTLSGQESFARGIDDNGQIVGEATVSSGDTHAFLWDSSHGMQDLNALIDPSSGWTLQFGTAINNEGQIVGYGMNPMGAQDAFLLTPVPEPSAICLLGAGVIASVSYALRWRRQPG
jgi:probable HAF family extracellular repeat protein